MSEKKLKQKSYISPNPFMRNKSRSPKRRKKKKSKLKQLGFQSTSRESDKAPSAKAAKEEMKEEIEDSDHSNNVSIDVIDQDEGNADLDAEENLMAEAATQQANEMEEEIEEAFSSNSRITVRSNRSSAATTLVNPPQAKRAPNMIETFSQIEICDKAMDNEKPIMMAKKTTIDMPRLDEMQ